MALAVIAPKKTLFERMEARPRDWSFGDVETVCIRKLVSLIEADPRVLTKAGEGGG